MSDDLQSGLRPWGQWKILSENKAYKVKEVRIEPGQRLSYQKHQHREEHWVIIEGQAKVTLDGEHITLTRGHSIDIPMGAAHRIENISDQPLVFVEIQTGTYFGEDDIERLEDDYGRL